MIYLLKNMFFSILSFVLVLALSLLALIQNIIPWLYKTEGPGQDYFEEYIEYEDSFELVRDEDAYQDSLDDVNALRVKCFYGTNQYLSGKVTAVVIYVDDFESSWTDEQMDEFTENDVEPALEFLEAEAKKYDVDLDFETKVLRNAYYDDEVIIDLNANGKVTVNVLDSVSGSYDFNSAYEMHDWMVESYGTEVVFITVFNKAGVSYGLNPKPWTDFEAVEHTVTFSIDLDNQLKYEPGTCATLVANSILYLYGGESLNKPVTRKDISVRLYPNDIMRQQPFDISASDIGEATAYYIGWIDYVPEAVYSVGWNESE